MPPSPFTEPPTSDADVALIDRARTGDETAFGELMQSHYPATFRLVLAIVRHEHDARDVCQEVWLTVWKTLPGYRGDSRFTTWLHPIATRRAIDHLRKRRRWFDRFLPFASSNDDFPGAPEPAAPDDTAADVQAAESRARYERALATLSPRLRAALVLREVEGLSYDEIALALDCPVGTVMSRLHQARRRLARSLRSLPPDSPAFMKTTALLLAAACLLGLATTSPLCAAPSNRAVDSSPPAATSTTIRAFLVIASKSAGKPDPRLAAYDETLRRVLRFESFRLVGQNSADITIPGTKTLDLGEGQRLELKTETSETNRRVQVGWFEGKTSLMKTGLVLRPGTPAVLGGPAHGEGEVYAIILTAN